MKTRTIKNSLFVAFRYLSFHRARTVVLILALSLIIFVPVFLEIVVRESQQRLNTRAEETPLLLGAHGSSLDLAVNNLYFILKRPDDIMMADADAIDETDLAYSIPLYTRFYSGQNRIVGTSIEYFDFRHLSLVKGRNFTVVGEAVLGANVAEQLNLGVGDTIASSPENLFDLAGQYPLQLNIVGALATTGTADDEVIFVDVATTWAMAGLFHGHQDLANTQDSSVILSRKENLVMGNAKVRTYNVITPKNLKSFHFHGDESDFPISAAIVVANDHKAETILLGRYQSHPNNIQLIRPKTVVQQLILSILRIKKVLDSVVLTVGISTLLTIVLVFTLSVRLRAKEIQTIFRLGCSRMAIGGFIAAEIVIISSASMLFASSFLFLARLYSDKLFIQLFL
jgi:putative ABC transport system permease protein